MKWPDDTTRSLPENYTFSSRPGDNRPVRVLIGMGLVFMAAFLWVYFQPQNRGVSWLFAPLTISVLFKLMRLLHEWYHYWRVKPVKTPAPTRNWTVDILTTYCPGEPREMVANTLRAIQQITYPHTTYLCDEADDDWLRQVCADLGVIHVTRQDKVDAKAGNINNALRQATGEICLIIDPDHVPVPDFLAHVLPHFEKPAVGFVQCVQGYYNNKESLVAFSAAEQTYSFYGPMMTCMGNYGTAQAIGANCTFRRSALNSIGGHANGLSEDMHTAMKLHAGGWQSVYVPRPLSYGLVPATLSAYYKQQLKWARGTFELLVTTYPRVFKGLSRPQRLHYATLPLYYLLGVVQLIDLAIPILSLLTMQLPLQLDLLLFGTVYIPLLLTGFLIRQYAQRWLIERHEAGFHLAGGILASGTWWVYVLGFIYTLFRVRVPYIPTPKDDKPRNHFLLVLPNLLLSTLTLLTIAYSIYWYGRFALNNIYFQLMIGFGLLNACIMILNVIIGQEKIMLRIGNWLGYLSARRKKVRSFRIMVWNLRYGLYYWLRRAAVPLFGGVLVLAIGMGSFTLHKKTRTNPQSLRYANTQPFYAGFSRYTDEPSATVASTSFSPIVPHHLNWSVVGHAPIVFPDPSELPDQVPLLYIEPSGMRPGSEADIRAFLLSILEGDHDVALHRFALHVRTYEQPVLVSFMPEFDNPSRPWGVEQTANLILCRQAWQYIVNYCRQHKATSITWIWCPFVASSLVVHYPGNEYVDWLGFPVTNDPRVAPDGKSHSFAALYQLTHTAVRTHAAYSIRQKPILITRLTSVTDALNNSQWINEALERIRERYPSIRGVIFDNENEWRTHRSAIPSR